MPNMKKVLIIDDEQSYLVKIKHIIEKSISDCTVLTAKTGTEGISIAMSELPDTILLDVVMPVLDGYSVCKNLKSNTKTQRIPIILVSAFQKDTDSRVRGLESGADVFLSKPFDSTELSAQVVAMLRIRSAEKAIIESNEKFRTVADFAHDWEYWIDNDGKIIYISPSCERITGYSTEEFIENQDLFYSIVHYRDIDMVKAHHNNMKNGCVCEPLEYRIIDKSGKIKWIGHVCRTVFNPNNENIGIRGSNREITKRKLAEEKVSLQTEELKIRNEELDAFAHTVAHDLRTPIGTIIGFADILNDGFDDITIDERREFLSHIEDTGHKSLQILNNLLLFAKVRKSDSPIEVLDMKKIVVETNNRLSSIIKKIM